MDIVRIAEEIARRAHEGQLDKAGRPYIDHPAHVAAAVEGDLEKCVAWLHDVVEDTATTLDDLRDAGLPPEVVEAVGLMTHDPAVPYLDYVRTIAANPLARAVKLADLAHNSDFTRLSRVKPRDVRRLLKYREARAILTDTPLDEMPGIFEGLSPAGRQMLYDQFMEPDDTLDGIVWMGVKSTGTYCRPVPHGRTPQIEDCEFFCSAEEAAAAGYRPCGTCLEEATSPAATKKPS